MSKLENATHGFTFDDFILVPQYSEVKSRKDPDISVSLPGFRYDIPIVSAPMNTVTEADMMITMIKLGGVGVLHRYKSIESQVKIVQEVLTGLSDPAPAGPAQASKPDGTPLFYVAVGANGDAEERVSALSDVGVTGFCVDVANGHNELSVQAVRAIRRLVPEALVMAGNVCTFDGAYRLAKAGANSIRVGIGPGCFKAGTRILMSNGIYKNIEDVRPGNRVINKDGKPATVKNAWCTGRRKVMKLRHTQFHEPTYCTDDHRYLVGDLNNIAKSTVSSRGYAKSLKPENIKWQEIGQLSRHTALVPLDIRWEMPDAFNIKLKKRTAGNRPGNFKYEVDAEIIPSYASGYIFGTFLGDGNTHTPTFKKSKRGSVHWCFGIEENATAEKLAACINSVLGKEASIETCKNTIRVSLYYKPFADFLKTFGKKENKKLPEQLFVNDKVFLQGLRQGLIDSDGHVEKATNRTGFTNTSRYLIELFGVIEHIIEGHFPNARSKGECVSKLVKTSQESFVSRRLATANKREFGAYQIVKILEKDFIEEECEVYDIEVDCPTHSFIANNAIVHNSVCTTRQVTGHGLPQLSAIEDCVRIKTSQTIPTKYDPQIHPDNRFQNTKAFPDVTIIADGGIRKSGDIVKALAIGADAVMLGGLLAGTSETPGEIIEENDRLYKYYKGMASNDARSQYKGQSTGVPEEGVSKKIPYTGKTASKIIENLCSSVKTGFSFSGANNTEELRTRAQWMRVTGAGYLEGTPHAK